MKLLILLTLLSLSFSQERLFYLMGTYALIELPEGKEYQAYRYMKSLEEKLSDYMEDSEVSRINKSAGVGCEKASEETLEVVQKSP